MAKSPVVCILDIGSSAINVVIAERGVNNIYHIHGKSEVEYSGFDDEDFLREGELVSIIGHALEEAQSQAGMKISQIYVGVPGTFISLVTKQEEITFPQTRRVIPEDIEEIYKRGANINTRNEYTMIHRSPIFYQLSDGSITKTPLDKKTDGLLGKISYCFARVSFTTKITQILRHYKITKVEFLSQNLAQGLFLTNAEERDSSVVLVDVGYITTNVMIASGEGLTYLKSFSLGGGHITADIEECFGIPFHVAEKFKRKIALSFNFDSDGLYEVLDGGNRYQIKANDLHESTRGRIAEISELIKICLDNSPQEFSRFAPMYITGGGIMYMRGAREFLSKELAMSCVQAMPKNPEYGEPKLTSTIALLEMALRASKQSNGILSRIFK